MHHHYYQYTLCRIQYGAWLKQPLYVTNFNEKVAGKGIMSKYMWCCHIALFQPILVFFNNLTRKPLNLLAGGGYTLSRSRFPHFTGLSSKKAEVAAGNDEWPRPIDDCDYKRRHHDNICGSKRISRQRLCSEGHMCGTVCSSEFYCLRFRGRPSVAE